MVSGYLKSIGISWVDGLSTGPPGFGASQIKYKFHNLEIFSILNYLIFIR